MPLEERTLAQALKEAGYATAIAGKWHLGHFDRAYLPTQRGFDHQYGHYNGAIDYFTHERDGGFDWHRDDRVSRDEGYSTTLLGDEAARVIREYAEILLNVTPNTGAIRAGDWKLVLNDEVGAGENDGALEQQPGRSRRRMVELFNLADDPYEKKNLAESHPEKVRDLQARYDRYAAEADQPKIKPRAANFKSPAVWGEK